MTYSLKLDCTGRRIGCVHAVLTMSQVILGSPHAARLRDALFPYVGMADDDQATLKLDLSNTQLDALEGLLSAGLTVLADMILRARGNLGAGYGYPELVVMQTETFCALRDVQTYRETIAAPDPYQPER
jgi:hypothetical protein